MELEKKRRLEKESLVKKKLGTESLVKKTPDTESPCEEETCEGQ